MFAKSIIESDLFLDLPVSARLLYFDLGMRGDDDGFVDSPKRIMRITGASEDDLRLLIAKQFLIPFESGVVVVRHWCLHNHIRGDRYKPTRYQLEKSLISKGENGVYISCLPTGIPVGNHPTTICQPSGCIGKDRIGKVSIVEDSRVEASASSAEQSADADPPRPQSIIKLPLNDKTEYPIFEKQAIEWAGLYPAVDVIQQLRAMKGWLDANPKRRKTKSGILRFINSWLSKEQNRGGSSPFRAEAIDNRPKHQNFTDPKQYEIYRYACEIAAKNGTPYFIFDRDEVTLSACCRLKITRSSQAIKTHLMRRALLRPHTATASITEG